MFRFLVVDDETMVRKSIIYAIRQSGVAVHEIREAASGAQALQEVQAFDADYIITDICMPEMDGLEFISAVRAQGSDAKVIVISGHSNFDYVRHALRNGALDYMLKPVKAAEMKEVLTRSINPPDNEIVEVEQDILEYLRQNYNEDISLERVASHFNFSPKYISQLISSRLGESFTEIVINLRMEKAKELLVKSNLSIKEIASYVGYSDQQYFHRVFKKKVLCRPSEYREQKRGGLAEMN